METGFGLIEASKTDFSKLSRDELETRAKLLSTILENMTAVWEKVRVEKSPKMTMRLVLDETLFLDEKNVIETIEKVFTEEHKNRSKS